MKHIGTTAGGVLVELSDAEFRELFETRSVLATLAREAGSIAEVLRGLSAEAGSQSLETSRAVAAAIAAAQIPQKPTKATFEKSAIGIRQSASVGADKPATAGKRAKVCVVCSKAFRDESPRNKARCCSVECQRDSRLASQRAYARKVYQKGNVRVGKSRDKKCVACGKGFHDTTPRNRAAYCSLECRGAGRVAVEQGKYARAQEVKAAAGPVRKCAKCGDGLHGLVAGVLCPSCRVTGESDRRRVGLFPSAVRSPMVAPSLAKELAAEARTVAPISDAAAAANPRNKKCAGCKRAFYDGTPKMERTFCGPKGCLKKDQGPNHNDGLGGHIPVHGGRVARVGGDQ